MNGPNQTMTSIWARLEKWAKASTRAEDRRPLSGFPSTQAGGAGGGGGGGQAGGGGGWPQSRPRFKAGLLAPWPLKSLLCLTASVPHLWPLLRSRWGRPHQLALQRMDLPRPIQDTWMKLWHFFLSSFVETMKGCGIHEMLFYDLWFSSFDCAILQNAHICKSLTCHHILFWLLIQRVVR